MKFKKKYKISIFDMVVVWKILNYKKQTDLPKEMHAYKNFTIAIATFLKNLRTHPLPKTTYILYNFEYRAITLEIWTA